MIGAILGLDWALAKLTLKVSTIIISFSFMDLASAVGAVTQTEQDLECSASCLSTETTKPSSGKWEDFVFDSERFKYFPSPAPFAAIRDELTWFGKIEQPTQQPGESNFSQKMAPIEKVFLSSGLIQI